MYSVSWERNDDAGLKQAVKIYVNNIEYIVVHDQ